MSRKDYLAAGARSARFAVGGAEVPGAEDDIFRNVAPEGTRDESEIVVEHAPVKKQIFKPLGTTILVRRKTVEEMSTIVITENMDKEQPAEGTVVVVGKKVVDIAAGDHVVFGKYSGTEFKLNGETLLIMDIEDIKGTVEDEKPVGKVISGEWVNGTFYPEPQRELNVGGCIVGRA
jgi:chaperonin GroES